MKRFTRTKGVITSKLEPVEANLLASLASQLIELLDDGEDPEPVDSQDSFALWARDLQVDPDEPEQSDDPVIKRLFPNPYPHDQEAGSDFRRFTMREMRDTKITSATIVSDDVAATQGGRKPLTISDDHVGAWLKTLSALRLSVAVRLGIDDEESAEELANVPDEDPRAFMASVYEWLGFVQESLLRVLST